MPDEAVVEPTAEPTAGPIVKPLPPELFDVHGSCAEMRWEAMRGAGYHVPVDRFFVRNHTRTPVIDAAAWRLELHGSGLRAPRSFGYRELLAMPSVTRDVLIECAGNGRRFFTDQQHQEVSGTPWRLGAAGVARWRGVPLAAVLELAGITPGAVDVMPRGLDPRYVADGVDHGRVRRPIPVAKALDDVILAYEMNGGPLPPDHGHPVRLVVPSWIGLASVKWVGDIEVSAEPLSSPWTTEFYRMVGGEHPPGGGPPLTVHDVKSAFELPWGAVLAAGRPHVLRGRSWSGRGRITSVEVSVDGGASWRPALLRGAHVARAWTRWHVTWNPPASGSYTLLARAADETGAAQPMESPYNELGYLFNAVVQCPVRVVNI
ncbi:sulfite oxidase [Planomonospora parontospora]|uniref:sulfite oxidase n=1 Tax=Planomonospora parontospora TaxID=58119 RepID=UPI00166FD3C5|nr:sulfite oxidase [Planomonospora parontospora]GGL13451.1 sulfite oxidase [Planomonospora parontospora subsp. antibiotica]GII13917.1 sulfite oxidase [Planomonospora parontospora subsp. antibiotica]